MYVAHAKGLLRFVIGSKRARTAALLRSPAGTAKLLSRFPHFDGLDPRYVEPLEGSRRLIGSIEARLRELRAPLDCCVVSREVDEADAFMSLGDALLLTVGHTDGTFVSCIAGALGYFENETGRWILRRT